MRRTIALALFVSVLGAAGAAGLHERGRLLASLPAEGHAARGIRIEGRVIPDDKTPADFAKQIANERLDQSIRLVDGDTVVLVSTLRELGGKADLEFTEKHALAIARSGTFRERIEASLRAEAGAYDVALPLELPSDALAARLEDFKEATDTRPRAAKRFVRADDGKPVSPNGYAAAKDEVTPHTDGLEVDVYATADALIAAADAGADTASIVRYEWVPRATRDAVQAADIHEVVASFETRYGGPPGRDKNVSRATSLLDGTVLMPGATLSYNDIVGPRSAENGFYPAPEIYKGEMRQGIGGGACQVASTLHAAAFFGGLDVLERRNHSRPSGYIRPGLDATVSFPVLDLRIRNPFDFPVIVHAQSTNGVMRFELLGKQRKVDVALATETIGILDFKRKLEKAGLHAGDFKLKQKGKRGMQIRRIRTVTPLSGGEPQVEISTDTYPATQEIWLVAPDVDPSALPTFGAAAPGGQGV